jgi:hypothetical protein
LRPFSRLSLAVYLFYLALALLITFPLILHFSSQMLGHSTGDTYEMGHHIWWLKYALQNGEPLFWQTLSGYPDGFSAVSLWSNPLQFFPAWGFAFFMPVASAYNLTVLLTMALNGWAMALVMSRWLAQTDNKRLSVPALLAGAVYMAFPTMQGHLFAGHAGLLVAWGAPLYIYALFKLVEQPSWRWFGLAVLFFLLTPSGHTLQLIYVLMPITGLFVLTRLIKRDGWGALRVMGVSIVGSLLLLVFLLPVFSEAFSETYEGDTGFVRFSIDLLGIVTPSFGHPLFGQFETTGRVLGVNLPEGYSYLGVVAAILSLIAVLARRAARWWLLLALIAWMLALGPVLKLFDTPITTTIDGYSATITPPWAFLYGLPGFNLARTPGRFTFTLALAIAVMVGYGADVLWQRRNRGVFASLGLAVLGAMALWEYQAFFPAATVPADVPQAVIDLRTADDVEAVMDVPWGNLLAAKHGMYLQTWHQQPVIAGQVTRRTPVSPAKLTMLEETLDLALLEDAGVDVMILHKAYASAEQTQRLRDGLGAPYFEDDRFALFRVPSTKEGLRVEWQLAPDTSVNSRADSYLFTPSPGWMDFSGTLDAKDRTAALYLDGQLIYRWTLNGETPFTVPLPVAARGYHTLSLAVEPPCPQFHDPTLRCRGLDIAGLTLTPLSAGPLYEPVQFERGVTLAGWYLPADLVTGDTLPVRLWWTFDAALTDQDVRFIKLLDANGQPVAELDSAPGAQNAGDELAERLELNVSDLSGSYAVYAGWYSLPGVNRFPVLSPIAGAQDGWVFMGTVTID